MFHPTPSLLAMLRDGRSTSRLDRKSSASHFVKDHLICVRPRAQDEQHALGRMPLINRPSSDTPRYMYVGTTQEATQPFTKPSNHPGPKQLPATRAWTYTSAHLRNFTHLFVRQPLTRASSSSARNTTTRRPSRLLRLVFCEGCGGVGTGRA